VRALMLLVIWVGVVWWGFWSLALPCLPSMVASPGKTTTRIFDEIILKLFILYILQFNTIKYYTIL
jgi:hypothetical protein